VAPRVPTVPAGIRGTTPARSSAVSQSPSGFVGKRKANELISSGEYSEPAIRRLVTGAGSAPHSASPNKATGEQASGGWQLGFPEGGKTYATLVAAHFAPHLPNGPLTPSRPGRARWLHGPRRMSCDISGPMSGITISAHVAKTCVTAGEQLRSGRRDQHAAKDRTPAIT
jgi:hypothetical protein